MMKSRLPGLLSALALLVVFAGAARADEFSRIENSPYTYWVPAPTPGYAGAPYYRGYGGYYAGPPGYYYGPPPAPPPPPVVVLPRFFFGIHIH